MLIPKLGAIKMAKLTLKPADYLGKDIDLISDTICGILADHHGVVVDSLSFEIVVNYKDISEENDLPPCEGELKQAWYLNEVSKL
tara:strand:- start:60 stop:314 length:255 start_codon:yes stop_codon:yes gene_type:complete